MKDNTIVRIEQQLSFETLESMIRGEIEGWMQPILDEEVTEFLGRMKSERRKAVDDVGYRNGYGEPRKLTAIARHKLIERSVTSCHCFHHKPAVGQLH